jgi:hypothetical protein
MYYLDLDHQQEIVSSVAELVSPGSMGKKERPDAGQGEEEEGNYVHHPQP